MVKKSKDSFYNLKYIGYCISQMPPEGAETEFEDLVRYCKFYLCRVTKRLLKDPIWDSYEDEEIIVEYFAHLLTDNEKELDNFKASLTTNGYNEDIYDWLDKKIEDNQKELKDLKKTQEDKIEFSPDTLGD